MREYAIYEFDSIKERKFRRFANRKDAELVLEVLNNAPKVFECQSSFRIEEKEIKIESKPYRIDPALDEAIKLSETYNPKCHSCGTPCFECMKKFELRSLVRELEPFLLDDVNYWGIYKDAIKKLGDFLNKERGKA